jgi:hypothetical protein
VRAEELVTERLHYGDPNFRHSSDTSPTNLPNSQSMEFVLSLVIIAIEEHHKYRDGTGWRQIAPVPIRTKCITIVWGKTPPDLIPEVQGFERFKCSYSNAQKDALPRNRVISHDYAWPTWKQFSRKDNTAGTMSLSSDGQWANGVEKQALQDEIVAKKKVLDFWSSWRDAPMD